MRTVVSLGKLAVKPTKKELVLAGLIVLLIPLVVEILLRLSGIQFQSQLYVADDQFGWALRKGARGLVADETQQYIRINSHGFHDYERSYGKPANTVRIAILGNSWTEALQVPLDKAYPSVVERKLAEKACFPGKQVEVLNFGVSGYSTAQEFLLLKEDVWKYNPDIVIVAFYSARDVANNFREFNNAANPEQSPYFVYNGHDLVLDASFRSLPAVQKRQIRLQNLRGVVTERIVVLQAGNALVRYVRTQIALAQLKERSESSGGDSLEHSIYKPPVRPALQEAWRVTEGLLVAMRDEAKLHGAEFRIITLANRPQVIPDMAKRFEFMRTIGVSELSYADERIKALGAREGIPVTTLAPFLASYAEAHKVYLNGFNANSLGVGHWNEVGHRLAGEVIADAICHSADVTVRDLSAVAR